MAVDAVLVGMPNSAGIAHVDDCRLEGRAARTQRRIASAATAVTLLSAITAVGIIEFRTSALQAVAFSQLAGRLSYVVSDGASESIRFPRHGPRDLRLGYVDLPRFAEALRQEDFSIERQARMSDDLAWYVERGGYAPYRASRGPGLTLLDRHGRPIYQARQPDLIYQTYDSIPPPIVDALLFIENRELLDPRFPVANPAVEWDRLAAAFVDLIRTNTVADGAAAGGSTLATQLVKLRHSPGGRTGTVAEKLRQMVAASLHGYLDGPDTREARRRIVVDYLNATPLAAQSGYGEVIGLGDGLRVWFGAELDAVNRILSAPAEDGPALEQRARAYRQMVTLLLAQRRPSELLRSRRTALARLTDSYLRLMADAGVIDDRLRDAALAVDVDFRDTPVAVRRSVSEFSRKAAATFRVLLLENLGPESPYDLDRLDLTVETSLDKEIQERVTEVLKSLSQEEVLEALGLIGPRLLDRRDTAEVIYSLILYERGGDGNYLRVQADSQDLPFDINEGAKLDLGSTRSSGPW